MRGLGAIGGGAGGDDAAALMGVSRFLDFEREIFRSDFAMPKPLSPKRFIDNLINRHHDIALATIEAALHTLPHPRQPAYQRRS